MPSNAADVRIGNRVLPIAAMMARRPPSKQAYLSAADGRLGESEPESTNRFEGLQAWIRMDFR